MKKVIFTESNLQMIANKMMLTEGAETRHMNLAKHYLYDGFGYDEQKALKTIGAIKTDIPNVRLGKCKFILGVTRMFMNGELSDYSTISKLNQCLRLVASDAHIKEYDSNLNNMNADDVIERFSNMVSADIETDKNDLSSNEYTLNNEYEIVRIDYFEEAEEYADYVSWCVTHDSNMFDSYTNGGTGVFYFCLRDGFEDEEEVTGENCPLDQYGLSMIAVSVNSDGSCNTITCRWNHDNGGNDSIMTTKQLSNLLGVNFYDVFKPLTEKEIELRQAEKMHEIQEEMYYYYGSYTNPGENGCEERTPDPDYGDTVNESFYIYVPYNENINGCVLINDQWDIVFDMIFENIGYREGDCMVVERGGKYNVLVIIDNDTCKLISDEWYDNIDNTFRHGFCKVLKNGKWNVMRKDGSLIFDNWYDSIMVMGMYSNNPTFELMYGGYSEKRLGRNYINGRKTIMADANGNMIFDKPIEHFITLRLANDMLMIQFEGDDFHMLYDKNTFKQLSPIKFSKLMGYQEINAEYMYKTEGIDGNIYLISGDGKVMPMNNI